MQLFSLTARFFNETRGNIWAASDSTPTEFTGHLGVFGSLIFALEVRKRIILNMQLPIQAHKMEDWHRTLKNSHANF